MSNRILPPGPVPRRLTGPGPAFQSRTHRHSCLQPPGLAAALSTAAERRRSAEQRCETTSILLARSQRQVHSRWLGLGIGGKRT